MLTVTSSTFELVGTVSSSNIFTYKICDRLRQIPQDFLDVAQLSMTDLQNSVHPFVVCSSNVRFYAVNTPDIRLIPPVRIKKSSRRHDLCSQFSGFSQCLGHRPPFMVFIEVPECDGVPRHHDLVFSKVQNPEVRDFRGCYFTRSVDPMIWVPQMMPGPMTNDATVNAVLLLPIQPPSLQPSILQVELTTAVPRTSFSTSVSSVDTDTE